MAISWAWIVNFSTLNLKASKPVVLPSGCLSLPAPTCKSVVPVRKSRCSLTDSNLSPNGLAARSARRRTPASRAMCCIKVDSASVIAPALPTATYSSHHWLQCWIASLSGSAWHGCFKCSQQQSNRSKKIAYVCHVLHIPAWYTIFCDCFAHFVQFCCFLYFE